MLELIFTVFFMTVEASTLTWTITITSI